MASNKDQAAKIIDNLYKVQLRLTLLEVKYEQLSIPQETIPPQIQPPKPSTTILN